jgi:Asp-tRNA(Asn)/Glu-tRNA(Gln) amidotransferase A subunit family amidase
MGTDIGGSIRIPGAFNGLRAFKPTSGRVSIAGIKSALKNSFTAFGHIKSAAGPLGRSVDDLKLAVEVELNPNINKYDPTIPPTPFRQDLYDRARSGKIRVGYLESLQSIPCSESMKRAMRLSKKALEDAGYEIVPIDIPIDELLEHRDVFIGLISNAYMGPMLARLEEEAETELPIYTFPKLYYISGPITRFMIRCMFKLANNPRNLRLIKNLKPLSTE